MARRDLVGRLASVREFRLLHGNCRVTVGFELAFSIGNVLCNFYQSLYMRARGLSAAQIGTLVTVGYVASMFFAMFAGETVNRLGRRRSALIFELTAWAGSSVIFFFADRMWLFVLAKVVNSLSQISMVAWNFLILEDATSRERMTAFNLLAIMHTAVGVLTPVGGLIVARIGLVKAGRIFYLFAAVVFAVEMVARNHFLTETAAGQKMLEQKWEGPLIRLDLSGIGGILRDPLVGASVAVAVLYNMTLPLSSRFSLYLNIYFTDVLGIDDASVSAVGGVLAAVMLASGLLLIPRLNRRIGSVRDICRYLGAGFLVMIPFQLMMVFAPRHNLLYVCAGMALYAVGYSAVQTYIDLLIAEVTESHTAERGSIYASMNLLIAAGSMAVASVSGPLYQQQPSLLFWVCAVLLTLCLAGLAAVSLISRGRVSRAE